MPFSELDFQPRAKAMLTRAIANKRVAHAYLFAGPEGTGKQLAARLLAQSINCERQDGDACGVCPSCDPIARSMDPDNVIHPDIWHLMPGRWVAADGRQQASHTIVIDAVRDLCARLYSAPLSARWRLVILHEADTMQIAAQNAFLKTLEEPLERLRTVFILLSSRPRQLLPTIHSRSQVVRFGYLAEREIIRRLRAEELGEDDAERERVAALAAGNLAEARRMLQNDECLNERRSWIEAWRELISSRGENAAEVAERIGRSREELDGFLKFLLGWHRDLLAVGMNLPPERILNRDYAEWLREEAAKQSPQALLDRVERILEIQGAQELYARGDLALLNLLTEAALTRN